MGVSAIPPCLLLLTFMLAVSGFPQGAPGSACQNMTPSPKFHGQPQDPRSFPYDVKCEQIDARRISVQVSGKKGLPFRGLLVSVRDSGNLNKGTVKVSEKDEDFMSVCNRRSVTHRNKNKKMLAKFTFELQPGDMAKRLKCVYTVVKQLNEFWVQHSVPLARLPRDKLDRGKKVIKKGARPTTRRSKKGKKMTRKKSKKQKKMKMPKSRSRRSLTKDIRVRTKRSLKSSRNC